MAAAIKRRIGGGLSVACNLIWRRREMRLGCEIWYLKWRVAASAAAALRGWRSASGGIQALAAGKAAAGDQCFCGYRQRRLAENGAMVKAQLIGVMSAVSGGSCNQHHLSAAIW